MNSKKEESRGQARASAGMDVQGQEARLLLGGRSTAEARRERHPCPAPSQTNCWHGGKASCRGGWGLMLGAGLENEGE